MPEVAAKLPLDSPLWGRLSACYSAENAIARLREMVRLGEDKPSTGRRFVMSGEQDKPPDGE